MESTEQSAVETKPVTEVPEERSVSPSDSHSSIGTTGSFSTTWTNDKILGCCNGFCNANPSTRRGRQVQMIRILSILFLPMFGVTMYAIVHLIKSVRAEIILGEIKVNVLEAEGINDIIHAVVLERSEAVLHLAMNNNSEERVVSQSSELRRHINATDLTIMKVSRTIEWPELLKKNPGFESPERLMDHLNLERETIEFNRSRISSDIAFYNNVNVVLIEVLIQIMTRNTHLDLWRLLIANKMLSRSKENFGLTMATGIEFLMLCELPQHDYLLFMDNLVLSEDHLATALSYSPHAKEEYETELRKYFGLKKFLDRTHKEIADGEGKTNDCSYTRAHEYFYQMQQHMKILMDIAHMLDAMIIEKIDDEAYFAAEDVTLSVLVFVLMIICTPTLTLIVYRLIASVAFFAQSCNEKSFEIAKEKKKANELLYTMLPRSVAAALINKTPVQPRYYDDVTVYFSDIVGFAKLSTISNPMQIVAFLNKLYAFIDEKIDKYDVYKVETIGDVYMIVSGLPHRNGRRHAAEIGKLSLELLEDIQQFTIPHLPKETTRLRVGLNTGPCCAGVVGLRNPRYCLFGDTVNTASRMGSNGAPMKIHISRAVKSALEFLGGFRVKSRGKIPIKGKGMMETAWLEERDPSVKPIIRKASDFI